MVDQHSTSSAHLYTHNNYITAQINLRLQRGLDRKKKYIEFNKSQQIHTDPKFFYIDKQIIKKYVFIY